MNIPEILAVAAELRRVAYEENPRDEVLALSERLRAAVQPMDKAEGLAAQLKAKGFKPHSEPIPEPRDEREGTPVAFQFGDNAEYVANHWPPLNCRAPHWPLFRRPAGPSAEALAVAGELEKLAGQWCVSELRALASRLRGGK